MAVGRITIDNVQGLPKVHFKRGSEPIILVLPPDTDSEGPHFFPDRDSVVA